MSSYANGCMTVVLPVEHIGEFERYFDQDYEYSFRNTEITLTESENVEKAGYQKRIYDISCNTSLPALYLGGLKIKKTTLEEFLSKYEGYDFKDLTNVVKMAS